MDGSIMAAKNLGKKSYSEVCRAVGVPLPHSYIHRTKYKSPISEREAQLKKEIERREQRCIAFLVARGFKVTKPRLT